MEALTDKQAAVLRYVTEQICSKRRPPSVREIAARFRFSSPTAARDHVAALERKGYIEVRAGEKRCLGLTREYEETLGLPVVGLVAAGAPILAEENIEDYLHLGEMFPRDGRHFCLRVKGDSMIGEGILDGDLVVVRQKPDFDSNEVGVAIIEGECTVKRLRREPNRVLLIPANPAYGVTEVDPERREFRYGGEVVGVIRRDMHAGRTA
ncbi:MAG: transcriptional repressor LexA [Planctomycetes bacterium]|nr:transcriptional repressor LexA [Planctomycetota bacterium]